MSNDRDKVLIVEDEVLIAYAIKKMLDPHYDAEMAHDFEEAKNLLALKHFDLVLIDITLSGSKTGLALADYINENLSIPFIFTTALTDFDTLNRVKAAKPAAYLSKPIESANLITAIGLALNNNEQNIKIQIGKQSYYCNPKDFLYAEANHIYIELFFQSRKNLLLRITMLQLEEFFPAKYLRRINRSVAVNPIHITEVVGDKLYVGDQVFKVSKNF
jgi:DNA-binding LytR/AlgR family response regulator